MTARETLAALAAAVILLGGTSGMFFVAYFAILRGYEVLGPLFCLIALGWFVATISWMSTAAQEL